MVTAGNGETIASGDKMRQESDEKQRCVRNNRHTQFSVCLSKGNVRIQSLLTQEKLLRREFKENKLNQLKKKTCSTSIIVDYIEI